MDEGEYTRDIPLTLAKPTLSRGPNTFPTIKDEKNGGGGGEPTFSTILLRKFLKEGLQNPK